MEESQVETEVNQDEEEEEEEEEDEGDQFDHRQRLAMEDMTPEASHVSFLLVNFYHCLSFYLCLSPSLTIYLFVYLSLCLFLFLSRSADDRARL